MAMTRRTSRVLVVDDEPQVAMLLREFLVGLGHTAELAATGSAALEVISVFQPDVVLLDLGLPDVSGDIVLTRLREIQPQIAVIVMTGHDPLRAQRSLEDGAFANLAKPFRLERLREVLDAALETRG
jgi:DNA-binding NtrC family response regulator